MKFRYFLLTSMLMFWIASVQAALCGRHTFATTSRLATGTWIKVSLEGTEDGIFQITYDQLSKMGFSNPEKVAVYGYGGHVLPEAVNNISQDDLPEVATLHDTAQRRILFYGQGMLTWSYNISKGFHHRQNTYDTKAYYFLHEKEEGNPLTMESLAANDKATTEESTQYDVHFVHEEDLINLGQSGREKYGESFVSNTVQKFDFEQVAAGQVRVTVNFAANSTESSTLSVSLNDKDLGQGILQAKTNEYAFATETTIDQSVTLDESTGLSVKLTYTPAGGNTPTTARLNYIRVFGKRDFAKPAQFELFRNGNSYARVIKYVLGNAVDDDIQVWDVTSPTDVKRQMLSDGNCFCPTAIGVREYALVNIKATNFPTVKNEGVVANQNLHALPMTNMVIITAPAYYSDACQLALFRQQTDNLHVTVVTPEQIYNEFSSGKQDVTALRLFMKMFYDRYHLIVGDLDEDPTRADELREPLYLLLWGDGHYDNLNIDRNYYLPCYETDISLTETYSSVCDDYFGFLDDFEGGTVDTNLRYTITRDAVDVGIGRLPVSSEEQSANVLNKIINYSSNAYLGTWKNRLCFLSDDDKTGDSYNCHVKHNDQLVNSLQKNGHQEFVFQKIYLPAYKQTQSASGTDYPDAKKEFQEALKQGVLIVNYAGHGNTTAITNENMMTASAASALNMKYLPLWVTASCDVSRWDEDGTSMGECLLLNPNGGAIALLSTVRVVYAQQNLTLNQAMIDNIFNRFDNGTRYRLGDVIRASKVKLDSDYNKLNFCLLGDPSLTLSFPEQKVEVTEINGQPVSSNKNFDLKTLSTVTVKGHILQTGSNTEVDTSFNGLVYPTFFDAEDTLTADKGAVQAEAPTFSFTTRTKKAFSGRGLVKDGEFEFSFTVPIDISYKGTQGLANFYACSDESAEASGYFNQYCLTGTDDYQITDTEGPSITQLFLNDNNWKDGGAVNATPYFFAEVKDESGFNATGNTVGHDMVLTIRCTSNPLLASEQHSLNDYFTTYTGDRTTGNIQYSIPALEDGTYEATFRIWDVFNNPTTRKFTFTVQSSTAPEAVVVQAYPCPAKTGDTITFRVLHNRPESAQEMTVQVYTQTGYKVFEKTVSSSSASKVYATSMEDPTRLNSAINADESGDFMGSSTIYWDSPTLRAGFYLYRVLLSCDGSAEMSKSKLLMVNP